MRKSRRLADAAHEVVLHVDDRGLARARGDRDVVEAERHASSSVSVPPKRMPP
jgi:hypothetical protein